MTMSVQRVQLGQQRCPVRCSACEGGRKPLNIVDLKRFLDITIFIGITRLPSQHLYWSFRRDSILGTGKTTLSLDRYT